MDKKKKRAKSSRKWIKQIIKNGTKGINRTIATLQKKVENVKKKKTKTKYAKKLKRLTLIRLQGLQARAKAFGDEATAYEYGQRIERLKYEGGRNIKRTKQGSYALTYKLKGSAKTDFEAAAETYGWYEEYASELEGIENEGERREELKRLLIRDEKIILSRNGEILVVSDKEEYMPNN